MNKGLSLIKALLIWSLLLPVLSGCWDVVDIEKRELLTGLALDLTENSRVLLTAQIPVPRLILPSSEDPSSDQNFYTLSVQGATTLEAFNKFKSKTSGQIDTIKTNILIIGEKIAARGVKPYLDTIGRMPKFPVNSHLLLSRGEPGSLLQKEVASKTLPTFYLRDFLNLMNKRETVHPVKLWNFFYKLDNSAIDPFLPVLYYDSGEKIFILAGLAAFSGDKLAVFLTPEESKIYGILSSEQAEITLFTQWQKARFICVRYINSRVVYEWSPPQTIMIHLTAAGYLMEETGATLPLIPDHISKMEKALARQIKEDAEKLIRRLQAANSDLIGLGRVVRANHEGKWTEEYWRKLYPTLQIEVKVDFNLTRTGRLN